MSSRNQYNGYQDSRYNNRVVQQNSYSYQQQQQQQLQQLQYDDQVQQQEIKYAIFKDLEYVLVILAQTQTVLDYFQNDQDNPMISVAFNRLITQINLSNSINFDQYNMTRNNKSLRNELNNCKSQARQLFQQLSSDFKDNKQLRKMCDYYLNQNLAETNTTFQNIPLQQIQGQQQQNQLSQSILESIISSINHVDKQYNSFKNGSKYQQPTAYQLKEIMITKQQEAHQKLSYNFKNKDKQFVNQRANSVDNFKHTSQLQQSYQPYQLNNHSQGYPSYNQSYIHKKY